MTVRLWIETTHHPAFRYGGWAYVRQAGGLVTGAAGGERGVTPGRLALHALVSALKDLPPGAVVALHTASPCLLAAARLIERPPEPDAAPSEDLDLWAHALGAIAGRTVTVHRDQMAARTPAAFLAAWAEVGQDKAKMRPAGRLRRPFPKPIWTSWRCPDRSCGGRVRVLPQLVRQAYFTAKASPSARQPPPSAEIRSTRAVSRFWAVWITVRRSARAVAWATTTLV